MFVLFKKIHSQFFDSQPCISFFFSRNSEHHFNMDYALSVFYRFNSEINQGWVLKTIFIKLILFVFFSELVYVYSCEWNYRPDHCMYQNNCQSALHNGVYVIHGNRGVFHNHKQPAFRLTYNIIKDYKFGENIESSIIERVLTASNNIADRYCKLMVNSFIKNMLGTT